jgi:hypothetical protein
MRLAGLVVGVLSLAATPVPATPLTDVAASLAPGQWGELATTNFNEATLGDGTSFAVFWFSEDLAWDGANRRLYFVGGGHDSDAQFLTWSESTNAWTRAKPAGGVWHPTFSHAYDHLALIPSRNRLYFRQPASDSNDRIEIYDIGSATWSRSAVMPSRPACCGALEYFPELGGLVMAAGPGPVFLYDPGGNSWRELANNVAIGDFHNFAEYSPVHRVMIFGGGEGANGRALFRINANGQVARLGDAPQRIGITYSVVTTDPVSGDFLVFFDNASWQFNPITDTWTPLSAVPPWRSLGSPGIFAAVATPIPELGIVVVAKYAGDNSRVYLYRHSASVPRPSISLRADPATVASGGSSVLSWTTGATSDCSGSRGTAAWPGPKATNGTENVGPISAATTFMLSCSGPGGAMQS